MENGQQAPLQLEISGQFRPCCIKEFYNMETITILSTPRPTCTS